MRVYYSPLVAKRVRKRKLPGDVWQDFSDAFESLAKTGNFRLFDIKKIVIKGPYVYYRLRIRDWRALFRIEAQSIYVEDVGPRREVYRKWE